MLKHLKVKHLAKQFNVFTVLTLTPTRIMIKHALFLAIPLLLISCGTSKLIIPAQNTAEIDFSEYEFYEVMLKNGGQEQLEIAVINKDNDQTTSGFGLNKKGEASIAVAGNGKLVIKNPGDSPATVRFITKIHDPVTVDANEETYIRFTLANNSNEDIPLIIPTVMNPNLSPNSRSGVDLRIGQEILFKSGTKKYVLLTVDENIENGAVLDVAKLLSEKKKELGLK